MFTTQGYVANPWRWGSFANPISQNFPIHQEMLTPRLFSTPYLPLSSCLLPCHGMAIEDESSHEADFAKFMNIARTDGTYRSSLDENNIAIDLSSNNFNKFQEAINFNNQSPNFNNRIQDFNNRNQESTNSYNRIQESTNFNHRFMESTNFNSGCLEDVNQIPISPAFNSSVQYPDYSMFSVNNSNKSLVVRNKQNFNQRQNPYARVTLKSSKCSNSDDVSSSGDSSGNNPHRATANGRERERTRHMNVAFAELRTHVPALPSDKMSKIQTLRLAAKYIHFLLQLFTLWQVLREGVGREEDSGWNCRLLTHERLGKKFSMWRLQGP